MNPLVRSEQALTQRLRRLWDQFLAILEAAASSGQLGQAIEGALNIDSSNAAVQSYLQVLKTEGADGLARLPGPSLANSDAMAGAAGAYVEALNRILINSSWLTSASDAEVLRVLAEEYGHSLDALFNGSDTPGDEGERFAALLLGYEAPASSAFENDAIAVTIDGVIYSAEAADYGGSLNQAVLPNTAESASTAVSNDTFITNTASSGISTIVQSIYTADGVDTIIVRNSTIPRVDPAGVGGSLGTEILKIENAYSTAGSPIVTYSLAGSNNNSVERLYLSETVTAGRTLIGNSLNNVIVGALGNDTLDGGLGNDTLIGNQSSSPSDNNKMQDAAGSNTYLDYVTAPGLSDAIAPSITTGILSIFPNSHLVLQFSESIQRTQAGVIQILNSAGTVVEEFNKDSGRALATGRTLTIDPTNPLAAGTSYTLRIDGSAISDLWGNRLGTTYTSSSFIPSGSDGTAPSLDPTNPYSPAINASVSLASNFVITFNEGIQRALLNNASETSANNNILLKNSAGTVIERFSPFASTWAIGDYVSGTTPTFTRNALGKSILLDPTNPLLSTTSTTPYRIEIQNGAITDRNGNPYSGNGTTYTFTASTANTASTINNNIKILSTSTLSATSSSTTTLSASSTTTVSSSSSVTVAAVRPDLGGITDFYFANTDTRAVSPGLARFYIVDYKGPIKSFPKDQYPLPDEDYYLGWGIKNFDKNNTTAASPTNFYILFKDQLSSEARLKYRLFRDKSATKSLPEDLSNLFSTNNQVNIFGKENNGQDKKLIITKQVLEDQPAVITQADLPVGFGEIRNLAVQTGKGEVSSNPLQPGAGTLTIQATSGDPTYTPGSNDDTKVTFAGDLTSNGVVLGNVVFELDILPVNDAPVIGETSTPRVFIENDPGIFIASNLTVSDVDDTQIKEGYVKIGNFVPGDRLESVGPSNIAKSYDSATGILSLTSAISASPASLADYQTLLRSVKYSSSSDNPTDYETNSSRTITWSLTDVNASGASNNPQTGTNTTTINITADNDAPVFDGIAAASYTENSSPVAIVSSASVSDVDATNFNGGTITVSLASYQVGDILSINNQGTGSDQIGVSGSFVTYGSTTIGTFSGGWATNLGINLNSAATPAAVQALMGQLRFSSSSDDPTVGGATTRALTVTLNDGGNSASGSPPAVGSGTSNARSVSRSGTITITPVNDAPSLNATAISPTFTEAVGLAQQGIPVALFTEATASTIESGQTFIGLEIKVAGLRDGAAECLVIDGSTISLTSGSGTTAINGMTYAVTIDSGLATINLSVDPSAGLSAAAFKRLIEGIKYQNTNRDDPTEGNRTVTITRIQDSGGTNNFGVDDSTPNIASIVTVCGVNDAPTLSATAAFPTPSFIEGAGYGTQAPAVNLFSGATANTIEAGQMITGLTFTLGGLRDGSDEALRVDGTTITLGADGVGTTATNAMSYTVSIASGVATVALSKNSGVNSYDIDALIAGIQYQNTNLDNPTAGTRTLTITQIQDSGGSDLGGSDTTNTSLLSAVTVVPINDAPETSEVNLGFINEDLLDVDPTRRGIPRTITAAQLLTKATDREGQTLSVSALGISSGSGTLVNNNNGTWTYTPVDDDSTEVRFTYNITDNGSPNLSTQASAVLDIKPINDSPIPLSTTQRMKPGTSSNEGRAISEIFGSGFFSDPDTGLNARVPGTDDVLTGVAITGYTSPNSTDGKWQYRASSGSFVDLPSTLSATSAIILTLSDRIRFLGTLTSNNAAQPQLQVKLIDSSTYAASTISGNTYSAFNGPAFGTGFNTTVQPFGPGTSPFSSTTISLQAKNDALI